MNRIILVTLIFIFSGCTPTRFIASTSEEAPSKETSDHREPVPQPARPTPIAPAVALKTHQFFVEENPVTVAEKKELKIALVMDQSASITQVQEKVAEGVHQLLQSLKGHKINFRIFDFELGNYMAESSDTTVRNHILSTIQIGGLNSNSALQVTDAEINQVTASIRKLTPDPDQHENGNRAIASLLAAPEEISYFKENDVGVVIVVTDENESSEQEAKYLNAAHKTVMKKVPGFTFNHKMESKVINFDYRLDFEDDGVQASQIRSGTGKFPVTFNCPDTLDINDTNLVHQLKQQNPQYAPYKILKFHTCAVSEENFAGITIAKEKLTSSTDQIVTCASKNIAYEGKTYADLSELAKTKVWYGFTFVENSCQEAAEIGQKQIEMQTLRQRMEELTGKSSVSEFIVSRSAQLFKGNFHLTAFVNVSNSTHACPMYSAQKIGHAYIDLAKQVNGQSVSICSPSYSSAVEKIKEFIRTTMQVTKSYSIPKEVKTISSLHIQKQGAQRQTLLKSGVDYDQQDGKIVLKNADIAKGDLIILSYL